LAAAQTRTAVRGGMQILESELLYFAFQWLVDSFLALRDNGKGCCDFLTRGGSGGLPSHASGFAVDPRGSFLIILKSFHTFSYLHRMCVLGQLNTDVLEGLSECMLTEGAFVQPIQCTM